jgi:hypothetical protein
MYKQCNNTKETWISYKILHAYLKSTQIHNLKPYQIRCIRRCNCFEIIIRNTDPVDLALLPQNGGLLWNHQRTYLCVCVCVQGGGWGGGVCVTGAYIGWWPYTTGIYKSNGVELFLQCTFVYWIKINKSINFQKYFFALFICI